MAGGIRPRSLKFRASVLLLILAGSRREATVVFESLTRNGLARPDEDSFFSGRIKQCGTKYVSIETKEQERVMAEARRKIVQIYLG
jgi:hypothetical protein